MYGVAEVVLAGIEDLKMVMSVWLDSQGMG